MRIEKIKRTFKLQFSQDFAALLSCVKAEDTPNGIRIENRNGAEELDSFEIPIEDTIDLHTFRPKEIAGLVEEYLYQAHKKGFREIRIIHGRGIGTQRQIVQSILRRHPQVLRFYDADDRGSTSIVLKQTP